MLPLPPTSSSFSPSSLARRLVRTASYPNLALLESDSDSLCAPGALRSSSLDTDNLPCLPHLLGDLDCKKLLAQGCQLAYNLKHPDALLTGALAKTGADLLLRCLSSRRSRSAANLGAWAAADAADLATAQPEEGGSDGGCKVRADMQQGCNGAAWAGPEETEDVVDPLLSNMLSVVLSGVLSVCTGAAHDAAAHGLPGVFGAPQLVRVDCRVTCNFGGEGRRGEGREAFLCLGY